MIGPVFQPRFSPSIEDMVVPEFKVAESVEVPCKIEMPDGTISSQNVRKVLSKPISHEEFENIDLKCDLFSVENLQRAGTDLFALPVGGAKFSHDSSIDLGEQINSIDFDKITINSQNIDSNENKN